MARARQVSTARWSRSVHCSGELTCVSAFCRRCAAGRGSTDRAEPTRLEWCQTAPVGAPDPPAKEVFVTAVDAGTTAILAPTRSRGVRATLRAYVALTKPRIIELLLVTTVPTMFLAAGGVPDLGLVLATLVGGTLAAGAANSLNCYVDRDIDQIMVRTGHRPLATASVSPREALVFGVVLSVASLTLMAVWVGRPGNLPHRVCDCLLRLCLHGWTKAAHVVEHRVGRDRGLHAGAHWLVGGHGLVVVVCSVAVSCGVLVDAATFLGAGDSVQGRLCRCRRADASCC